MFIKLGFEPVPHEPYCFIKGGIYIFFYIDDFVFAYKLSYTERVMGLIK